MTKEELKQINQLNREIKMWQKELNRLQCRSLIKGQEITGMPFVTGASDKVGDLVAQIADTEAVIRGILARVQIERRKILEYIDSIDDSIARQVIFLKCVSGLNWYQIARELGQGYTADAVKQIYYRRLKKDGIK